MAQKKESKSEKIKHRPVFYFGAAYCEEQVVGQRVGPIAPGTQEEMKKAAMALFEEDMGVPAAVLDGPFSEVKRLADKAPWRPIRVRLSDVVYTNTRLKAKFKNYPVEFQGIRAVSGYKDDELGFVFASDDEKETKGLTRPRLKPFPIYPRDALENPKPL